MGSFLEDFVKANEKAILKVAFEDLKTSKIHNENIDVRGYVMPREKDTEDDEQRKRLLNNKSFTRDLCF